MDFLPRKKQPFSGFTKAEVARMEQFLFESKEQSLDNGCYKKLARVFNRSSGRAGKPPLKWNEKHQQKSSSRETSSVAAKRSPADPEAHTSHKAPENPKMLEGEKDQELSRLEFEARSSKDGAWYDVMGHEEAGQSHQDEGNTKKLAPVVYKRYTHGKFGKKRADPDMQ